MSRNPSCALLCCIFFASIAQAGVTPSSLGFTSGGMHPTYGPTWIAPDGVAWYGVAKDEDGNVKRLSASKAVKLCKKAGSRLPEREDYELLADALGGENYTAPDFLELSGNTFAMATIDAVQAAGRSFPVSLVFVGDTGVIEHRPAPKLDRERYAVRCIAGRAAY